MLFLFLPLLASLLREISLFPSVHSWAGNGTRCVEGKAASPDSPLGPIRQVEQSGYKKETVKVLDIRENKAIHRHVIVRSLLSTGLVHDYQ